MNTYEAMLLNDEKALENTIVDYINRVINEEEGAEEALDNIKKVISFDFTIECDANWEPYASTLSATKSFNSIDEFKDANENMCGYYSDFDCDWGDDVSYGEYTLNKYDKEVSVFNLKLTDEASEEAKQKYDALLQKKAKEQQEERLKMQIYMLRRQLEEAEAQLN